VYEIIKKYKFKLSKGKIKRYSKTYPKLVTGVIIDATGKSAIKNSLSKKIADEHTYLRENPYDLKSRQRLRGLLTAARQANETAFPSIYEFAFNKSIE